MLLQREYLLPATGFNSPGGIDLSRDNGDAPKVDDLGAAEPEAGRTRGPKVAGFVCSVAAGLALAEQGRWSPCSAGGLIGGLLGGVCGLRLAGLARDRELRVVDAAAFVFPWPWALFRFGCFLAHDHLGPSSSLWIALAFPAGPHLDLGLIERLFMFALGCLYLALALDRSPKAPGFYAAATLLAYGSFRLALAPPRSDSPAGDLVLGAGCLAGGWYVLRRVLR